MTESIVIQQQTEMIQNYVSCSSRTPPVLVVTKRDGTDDVF